jgi:hypothetical protein
MNRQRQSWRTGDIFTITQLDGDKSLGQVIDVPMPNIASCLFFDVRMPGDQPPPETVPLPEDDLIAALWTTPDLLDRGNWVVIGHQKPLVSGTARPNEEYRMAGWVGAKTYGAGIVEKFLDAYYGLRAWDDWYDPVYLDRLLISPAKRPANVILIRSHE